MTLVALLLVGGLAAAFTAWALPRGGSAARIAAVAGVIALALIAALAAASPTPSSAAADATGVAPGTLWNGALAAGGYLRVVVVLGAASSVLMCGLTWLLRGTGALRGLLPGSLVALVGTTVALGATNPQLGIVAAGATGLASVPVVLAKPRVAAAAVAAREVRIAVATALLVLAVAAVVPALARLVLANPTSGVTSAGSGPAAVVALGLLVMATAVAARVGAIPYHVRISALADTAPDGSLPLVLAWLPLPLAAVAVGVSAGELAPLALPVGSAQALIVVLALMTTTAAGLVAAYQDDLRHAIGYLTLADLGLVLLAFAALDPVAWGPARTWLLTAAVTKTALLAWALVAEDRFETRSVPDLRGWLRPSPVLGIALVLILVATYGLPGWTVLKARLDLTGYAAGSPWDVLLLVGSLLTLPAYARWLWLGIGATTSHVDRATPEFLALRAPVGAGRRLALHPPTPGRRRDEGLVVEQEGSTGEVPGRARSAPAPRRTADPPVPVAARPRRVVRLPAAKPEPALSPDSPNDAAAPKPAGHPNDAAAPKARGSSKGAATPKSAGLPKPAASTALWAAPAPATRPENPLSPTLFDMPEPGDAPAPDGGGQVQPGPGSVRAGTGVGRRSRRSNGKSGSSPMTAPRAPEASAQLPSGLLAAGDELATPDAAPRRRPGRTPSGPDAATRAAAALRSRRTDLLSTMVLALALLATLVAFGAFDIQSAAGEPIPAVPGLTAPGN